MMFPKYLNKTWRIIFLIIFFFLCLIGLWVINRGTAGKYVFNTSSKMVIKELRSLSRLETAAFTIEKVIEAGTDGNSFQEILFGDRILLIAHGEVIAGFDLSQLDDDAVSVEGTTLRLTLPPPQILTTGLDPDATRVYDRKLGILSRGDKDLESAARSEAELLIREAACQGNILTEAAQNGRSQLTTLFKTFGFTSVIITVPQARCE